MENPQQIKVSCFGAGFVGLPTISVLACYNKQHNFVIYDIDKQKINKCQNKIMPIYQPGLQQTIKRAGQNLYFSSKIQDALEKVDIIFLALPTPTKLFGQQKGKAYDLSYTEMAIRQIVHFYNRNSQKIKNHVILVQKSTVPIGTARMITDLIKSNSIQQNKNKFIVVSNPQFLAEGSAIKDFQFPDRVVIGSRQGQNIQKLKNLYNFVDKNKIITTNQFSSQLSKLVNNCFLAQRVSSINSIAILCQSTQADIKQIKKCISSDSRIGDKFLNSSIGFGGSCFKKDILALIYIAQCKGLKQVANYWNAVLQMNDYRKKNFFQKIFKSMNRNLKFKKISVFGVAFKKDTNDARESPAIQICHLLLQQGAILNIFDPKTTMESFINEMKYHNLWQEDYAKRMFQLHTPHEAVKQSHAILILTEWDQFKTYKYDQFYPTMQKPSYIFDGRNILDDKMMQQIGYRYHRCGKNFDSIDNGFYF